MSNCPAEKLPKSIDWRVYGAQAEIALCALNKEKVMKHTLALLALNAALLISLPAKAADIDWKKVDAALGWGDSSARPAPVRSEGDA